MNDSAQPGEVLGHYGIIRLLGRGGMGEVYEAEDRKLGRRVALKILPRELLANSDRRTRFEREARTVAALKHPNIVTVHSIEEHEGQPFLVMELIEGMPLNRVTPPSGLDLGRFLDIAIQLAEAIGTAHGRGITHRDLKPGNILVDERNHVSVLDFGLAKWAEETAWDGDTLHTTRQKDEQDLTGEGQIVGTVAYMSPEQAEGKAVDHRSDVFSLGVVLYEMATGRRPFAGDSGMSLISSILKDEPDSVSDLRPAYPQRVGRVIRRCLQKDPSRRYQTVLDLRNDLLEIREDLDSGVLELGAAPAARPAPRGSRLVWLALAGALVAAIAIATFLWFKRPAPSSTPLQIRRLVTQGVPVQAAPAISPDGRYVAYQSRSSGVRSIRLLQVATGSDVELTPHDPNDGWDRAFHDLQFSRDGNYLYYTSSRAGTARTLWRLPTLGGVPEKILDRINVGAAVSPDGRWVAAVRGDEFNDPWTNLEVISIADRSVRSRTELPGKEFQALTWDQEGDSLIATIGRIDGAEGAALYRLSPDGGEPELILPAGTFIFYERICTAFGDSVLVNARKDGVVPQIWRIDTRAKDVELVHRDYNELVGCNSTPDGKVIATIREDVRSELWMTGTDGTTDPVRIQTSSGSRDGASGIAWLDDETLVYEAPDGEAFQLWQHALGERVSRKLTSTGGMAPYAQNGNIIYMGGWVDDRWGAYLLDSSGVPRLISPPGTPSEPPAVLSPDGQWFFYEELLDEGMVRLVRRRVDGKGGPEPVIDGTAHVVHFSPDGTRFNTHVLGEDGTWRTAVYPAALGEPIAALPIHSELTSPWASNDSIYHVRGEAGVRNIYEVDLATGEERKVTRFTEDTIFAFAVSPDLERLAIARGNDANELLLLELPE